jgi:hypothetical protein
MTRCEGKTRNGDHCKRDARSDSQFCYAHDPGREQKGDAGAEATAEDLEFVDLVPLLLAGILTAGLVFFLKGFGKWIPRL